MRAPWRVALGRGDVPCTYGAAITHPATGCPLVRDIFGEGHMLSRLAGRPNRTDIRRLRRLETDLAKRDAIIVRHGQRIAQVMEQRDALGERARAIAAPVPATPASDLDAERDAMRHWEGRLARGNATTPRPWRSGWRS